MGMTTSRKFGPEAVVDLDGDEAAVDGEPSSVGPEVTGFMPDEPKLLMTTGWEPGRSDRRLPPILFHEIEGRLVGSFFLA